MIAEFYGLPGSGKTTLMDELTRDGNGTIKEKIKGSAIPKIDHVRHMLSPEFLGFALRCTGLWLAKRKKDSYDPKNLRGMLRVYLIYMWEREHADGYCCFDHGIIQSVMSLIWEEYELRDRAMGVVDYFLRHMRRGLKVIYTRNTRLDVVYDRVCARQEYRRIQSKMNREDAMELLRFQSGVFDEIWAAANESGMGLMTNTMDPVETSGEILRRGLRL